MALLGLVKQLGPGLLRGLPLRNSLVPSCDQGRVGPWNPAMSAFFALRLTGVVVKRRLSVGRVDGEECLEECE